MLKAALKLTSILNAHTQNKRLNEDRLEVCVWGEGGAAADTGDRLSMKERMEELGGFTVSSEGGGGSGGG